MVVCVAHTFADCYKTYLDGMGLFIKLHVFQRPILQFFSQCYIVFCRKSSMHAQLGAMWLYLRQVKNVFCDVSQTPLFRWGEGMNV